MDDDVLCDKTGEVQGQTLSNNGLIRLSFRQRDSFSNSVLVLLLLTGPLLPGRPLPRIMAHPCFSDHPTVGLSFRPLVVVVVVVVID